MINKPSFKLVLSDTTVSAANLDEAVWLVIEGEGNPIQIQPASNTDWDDPKAGITAFSDLFFNEAYNLEETERGLHVFAGADLQDEFAGHIGYVHVNYKGNFVDAPSIESFPYGWAFINVRNGLAWAQAVPDKRSKFAKEMYAEQPDNSRWQPTLLAVARKHDWIDAIMSGRPVHIRIAGIRRYLDSFMKQWSMETVEQRVADKSRRVFGKVSYQERTMKDLHDAGERLEQGTSTVPAPKPDGKFVCPKLVLLSADNKKVDFSQLPSFYPSIYKNGKIYTSNFKWDPTDPKTVEAYQAYAEAKIYKFGNLPTS
jgi:hypothetical protein